MLLHDDVLFQILQWLPVISLLRFKLVCRTWRALVESNDFIKQHLSHHHYDDPNLKDKSHNLIGMVDSKKSPFTFPLISIDSSEEPNTCVQLDLSYLREYFPLDVLDTVSYNGIVCFSFQNCKRKHSICLWNPATRQSRVLPKSPTFTLERKHFCIETRLGLGFDVKSNDYKVVNLCRNQYNNEERVEVYSLNTDSWRSVTTVFPFRGWLSSPRIPFNNGTCFFWNALYSKSEMIICFDFTSERLRSIPFPNARNHLTTRNAYAIVASDKIACVSHTDGENQTKIWVLDGYGSGNESWVELYTIYPLPTVEMNGYVTWLFMKGNYIYFEAVHCIGSRFDKDYAVTVMVCRYNVVTKEIKNLSTVECSEKWNCNGLRIGYHGSGNVVDFKESLLSVGKGSKEMISQFNLEHSYDFACGCFFW